METQEEVMPVAAACTIGSVGGQKGWGRRQPAGGGQGTEGDDGLRGWGRWRPATAAASGGGGHGRSERRVERGRHGREGGVAEKRTDGGAVERGGRVDGAGTNTEEEGVDKIRFCVFLWVVGGLDDLNGPSFVPCSCRIWAVLLSVPCLGPELRPRHDTGPGTSTKAVGPGHARAGPNRVVLVLAQRA